MKRNVPRKYYTQDEIDFIKANCDKMTARQLGKHLGRHSEAIRSKCQSMGLNPLVANFGGYKDTLCWSCKNYCGGCSWSREFKPVKGWTAKETNQGYLVLKCPKFERG